MDRTADGVVIVPGLRVVNYDRRISYVVKPQKNGNPNEPIWYDMADKDGNPMSMMDGSRMSTRIPADLTD